MTARLYFPLGFRTGSLASSTLPFFREAGLLSSRHVAFIYIFLPVLIFHWCTRAFSSCCQGHLHPSCRAQASHCGVFSYCRTWALGHRLSSCGAWAQLLRGTLNLPRPGIEPCPLNWQVDSCPLNHQGSPPHVLSCSFLNCNHFSNFWFLLD